MAQESKMPRKITYIFKVHVKQKPVPEQCHQQLSLGSIEQWKLGNCIPIIAQPETHCKQTTVSFH